MNVELLAKEADLKPLSMPSPERHVSGVYIGDLLSWVMGRAEADNVWITIMSNINVVAVASLSDVACVVLAEGVIPDEEIIKVAEERGVNILVSSEPIYQTALRISGVTE